ncbi:ABC transporter substrate-binding protein [Asticcacaulis sp. EMRT-3]|uniref:ABC transporter substrate-binding protein n=1 Tax=Asticcacaulis sp. EMRT-3 TaxID=3040349 RepID=UPI0024AF639B|nr:ABC transporter substrate-binding protein [Asticcacaulis sp. EMRT-3]MDI7775345.1 ABC transporter substrate-binding protein [Asticcacaulis sp. EMRT-3]
MKLTLAYNPLNDAALILIAEALGFYDSEGLDVTLSREANWSNIRDKLAYGLIDAAHILAPMPFAAALGQGPSMGRIIAPMALGANGNSVLVSSELKQRLEQEGAVPKTLLGSARLLAREVERRRYAGAGRLVFAVPFTFSPHHFMLRHWVAAAGLDPERQIQWVVAPPSRMADMVKDGVIDGFCSGAPWPQTAQRNGQGEILFSDPDFWTLKPEKILGVRADWADSHPEATIALTRALLRAGLWASDAGHHDDLVRILARKTYVGATAEAIELALLPQETPGGTGLCLDPRIATFPWISHAKWFLGQMVRWGWLSPDHDFDQLARRVYRPDLWRQAAGGLGLNLPLFDEKDEGGHPHDWLLPASPADIAMPPDQMFDGGIFRCAASSKI